MKKTRILLLLASVAGGALITNAAFGPAAVNVVAIASGSQQSPQPASAIASVMDRDISAVEKQIAASNWFIWSPLTGDKLPEGLKDGNGPANLQTKTDIIKFLKDSFALGHKAAATLTTENILQSPPNSKSTRLHLAEFGVAHAYDHYGQMVEYLRMNGIVPPASRSKSE